MNKSSTQPPKKIKTFLVKLTVKTKSGSTDHQSFKMEYQKGVLLRTAWRDAILHMQKEDNLINESSLRKDVEYILSVTPLVFIATVKKGEETEPAVKSNKPTPEELKRFRDELENDPDMGEGEDTDDDDD